MSRSGYSDDCDEEDAEQYADMMAKLIGGNPGQAFFREMAAAMDSMPEKVLIVNELVTAEGDCCALGAVCKARGLDVSGVDVEDVDAVGELLGVDGNLAAEIEYMNDEYGLHSETPQKRWERMRRWVDSQIIKEPAASE